ncbi:MAG: leucine-rich repeat domain-containing protein [Flavobacteriales bacterium]
MINILKLILLLCISIGFEFQSYAQDFYDYNLSDSLTTKTITLRREKLTEIPTELMAFKNIEVLDLRNNKLDTLPSFISEFKHLKKILLSRNKFETFPEVLKTLKQLEHIDLWDNKIIDLNFDLEQFPNLKFLDISGVLLQPKVYKKLNERFKTIEFSSSRPCDCMED